VGLVFGPGGFPPFTVAERWDGTQWSVQPTPNLPGAYDISGSGPAVSCPVRSACTTVAGFTNNVPFFDNVGPSVTLAEQWNGNGPATEAAGNQLGASPSTRLGFRVPNEFRPAQSGGWMPHLPRLIGAAFYKSRLRQ
jgi:hypothetical protein